MYFWGDDGRGAADVGSCLFFSERTVPIPHEVLEDVLPVCQELVDRVHILHGAGIAKAVEMMKGCQLFVEPFKDALIQKPVGLATMEAHLTPSEEGALRHDLGAPIRQHFVFFNPHSDPAVERLRISHALAHCVMHWPLEDREERIHWHLVPDLNTSMYVVDYSLHEERQADAFACLMAACQIWLLPDKTARLSLDERLRAKITEYAAQGHLSSVGSPY
jgi:hypothetical protein